ncbi:MAG: hypothetical protein LBU72_03070 [Burkholderiaceae bacterium]|jgi:pyruvate,water dikinase|nr:hypothetical protein [Burkholderiaceae bacterium]
MKLFLSYDEAAAAGPERVGGKAWNLARLAAWGFPVPKGIAVERTLYRDVLALPLIKAMVEKVAQLDLDAVAGDGSNFLLDNLRAAIVSTALESRICDALGAALDQAGLTGQPVAVRSSASGEDGVRHAFAGIHESFLNLRGTQSIADAVLKCFASLWTVQAVAYRRRMGIADREIDGAVLICVMVNAAGRDEPAAAGVVFTADPQDGRRDVFVIEAIPGLGDKLVGGRAQPETLRARFAWSGFSFPESHVLPRDTLHELLIECTRVHWACSDDETPQDIEWAWDGKSIFILQARPVTVSARRTFPEIADQPAIWTDANLKEVQPCILSPMAWSTAPAGAAATFFDIHHLAGYHEPEGMQIIRRFDGRVYVNAAIIQFSAYDAFGISPGETNRTLGGFQPEISLPKAGSKRHGRRTRQIWRLARIFRAMLRGRKNLPKLLERLERRILTRSEEDLSHLCRSDLFAQALSIGRSEWTPPFMLANTVGSGWLGIARRIAGQRLAASDFDALAGGLMAARGGIVSADHAYALQAIRSRFAPGSPDYERAMAEWFRKYGHRGFNELDMAAPRWREVPDQVERIAQGLETGVINPSTAQAARNRAQAMLRSLPFLLRPILTYAIDKAAEGFRIREQAKSCLVAAYGVSRLIILEWGRRLAGENRIADRDDVFFLTFADFWAWAMGYWNGEGAQRLAAARKAQLAAWQDKPEPADVILEQAENLKAVRLAARALGDGRLQGSGVSPGQAHGTASKLHSPLNAAHLKDGDILVARSTDPSWTPLFLRASGIVVELGGYLSHGAIVAREFGLPAVVNIPGCFAAIPEQAQLSVDGSCGLVEIGSAQPVS